MSISSLESRAVSIASPASSSRAHNPFAIALAIGPAEREIERTADLLDSLATYAPGKAWFVMVDDAPQPRPLEKMLTFPRDYTPVNVHHARHAQTRQFIR